MVAEKKARDSRIVLMSHSPDMSAFDRSEKTPEKGENLMLDLDAMQPGESLMIPWEIAHEPSLRVRLARQNGKVETRQRKIMFCLLKHQTGPFGYPCFEVGCIVDKRLPLRRNVGSAEPAPTPPPITPPPMTFGVPPPLDEHGREIDES